MLHFDINTPILIALITFGLGFVLQLFYWLVLFSRLAFYKNAISPHQELPPVSVVICARNEYHHLVKHLPRVLEQDYPVFEVVVVNDCSNDETADWLDDQARLHKHLKVVQMRQSLNFFQGKKFPLSMGIKSARHEWLLLTDADCQPESNHWLRNMASAYTTDTDLVLGYGAYKQKPGILNMLIRFDTLHIGMQYLSMALAGNPYMGVGRNLSYRKSVFIHNKGFTAHYKIPSGDDDLFVSQIARKKNTAIVINEGARTLSEPHTFFGAWFRQKKRHLSTAKYYKWPTRFYLGAYAFSQFSFYIGFIWIVLLPFSFLVPVSVFLIRMLIQLFITKACMKQLGEKDLLLFSPIAEVLLILLNTILMVSSLLNKTTKWK